MRLSGAAAFADQPARDPETAVAVLRRARELGVDHVDTSNFYFHPGPDGLVRANELIRRALAPDGSDDDDLTIVTKVGPRAKADGGFAPFAAPEDLRAEVEPAWRPSTW